MQASAPSPPDRLPDRVWRRPCAPYKKVLLPKLPSPLSLSPSASLSFSLRRPSAIKKAAPHGRLHHVSIFPPTTTNTANAAPPSCARGQSPFAGHARARESLLILLTLAIGGDL